MAVPDPAPGDVLRDDRHDTIVALSSAPGVAARAIVRLSGPQAIAIASAQLDRSLLDVAPFSHVRRAIDLPHIGCIPLDVLVFRAPRSYTREDLVELHLPGAAPVVQTTLAAIEARGARPAHPGEFTRRAYLSGRLRLDQAEAVLALIAARSAEVQRVAATRLRSSARDLPELRKRFLDLLAVVEAYIDFTEDDTEALDRRVVEAELEALEQWARHAREVVTQQPTSMALAEVLLLGPRNAGKTTLFKRLVPGSLAIVSPIPGTTRDLLEGLVPAQPPFRAWDSPGVGEAADPLERQAIARALAFLQRVELVVVVLDGSIAPDPLECHEIEVALGDHARLVILTHLDKGTHPLAVAQAQRFARSAEPLSALAANAEIVAAITAQLALAPRGPESAGVAVDARLARALTSVIEHLASARQEDVLVAAEIVIFELREALFELTDLIAPIADEEMLDAVFGRFCIGK